MEEIKIETLLNIHSGDFELWKEMKYDMTFYHVSIEGYIGYENIKDFVDLYKIFLNRLEEYLIQNNHPKTEKSKWGTIFQTRAIEICFDHNYYWVFLDGYVATEIWDTYYYLEDVIKQLEELDIQKLPGGLI